MPWHMERGGGTCSVSEWAVIKDADGSTAGCHGSRAEAMAQVRALYANEPGYRRSDESRPGMETQYRSFAPDLQVRSAQGGRTVFGIAVPYDAPTRINDDLVETFARGAFNHQLDRPQKVKFAREHMLLGGELIGTATMLRDDPAGLYAELRVAKTPKGDETLELIKEGALDELSIAFREGKNHRLAGGVTQRLRADLREIAVVMEGAYGNLAVAAGVRSRQLPDAAMDLDLRAESDKYLHGLKPLPDNDLEIRRIRLGLPYRK